VKREDRSVRLQIAEIIGIVMRRDALQTLRAVDSGPLPIGHGLKQSVGREERWMEHVVSVTLDGKDNFMMAFDGFGKIGRE
jgi:hypothetical protein